MPDELSRRELLAATGAMAAGLSLTGEAQAAGLSPGGEAHAGAGALPHRLLGKTGVRVPILGFGTAPAGERRTRDQAIQLYHEAIDLGVNYFDTAPEFAGYGKAQEQLGYALRDRRKEVFLVTKCWRARGDEALKLLEANLKELQTDHADLVYAHSVGDSKMPLDVILGRGGVMEFLLKAKREGLTRFVGISGHCRPWKFLRVIRKTPIDVMMNAVNFADLHTYNFEGVVWPEAARHNIGLVAMKVFGGEYGKALSNSLMPLEHHESAFRYALSQPHVSLACIGMATSEELRRNVEWARRFTPMIPQEIAALEETGKALAARWKHHFGAVV
jgi:aryl-alcohol dehydrogenase-like predicted oxidoreductase